MPSRISVTQTPPPLPPRSSATPQTSGSRHESALPLVEFVTNTAADNAPKYYLYRVEYTDNGVECSAITFSQFNNLSMPGESWIYEVRKSPNRSLMYLRSDGFAFDEEDMKGLDKYPIGRTSKRNERDISRTCAEMDRSRYNSNPAGWGLAVEVKLKELKACTMTMNEDKMISDN